MTIDLPDLAAIREAALDALSAALLAVGRERAGLTAPAGGRAV